LGTISFLYLSLIDNHENRGHFFAVLLLLLSSCTLPPEYIGDKFPKTKHVDIYYSVTDIKRPYKVIGHLIGHQYFKEAEEKNLSQMAKSKGADAIIILPGDGSKPARVYAEALKYN
jgi:hypothetical protein